jgi:hypothetical protein
MEPISKSTGAIESMSNIPRADGAAGGRFAAGILSVALCAEASHATMDEDGAKVDLKLSLRNVFSSGSLITVHCQVKHGKSYRANAGAPPESDIQLKGIDSSTLDGLRYGGQPALLVWVPPPPSDTAYWDFIRPDKPKKTPIRINASRKVTPSLAYELCRFYNSIRNSSDFTQITIPVSSVNPSEKQGRENYAALKHQDFHNPLVGRLCITRTAWRHITRRSRSTNARKASLEVLPKLEHFLSSNPTRYATTRYRPLINSKTVFEHRDLLLRYDKAVRKDGKNYQLLVRIREEICYPRLWNKLPLGAQDVKQRATLVSWWYKK